MPNEKILVCDDEAELCATISEYLTRRNYEVHVAANGAELDKVLSQTSMDAIILDVNMPGEDGLSILRRIRGQYRVGIIMLTAMAEEIDRIVGLEMGADDYLAKPVSYRELEARLRAVLRRMLSVQAPASPVSDVVEVCPPIAFGAFVLDREVARLRAKSGEDIPLSPLEFRLLRCFAENPHRVLSRDQLLDMSHDKDRDPFDRSIDIRVSRLRQKIEINPRKPVMIRTVRGLGYVFDPEAAG